VRSDCAEPSQFKIVIGFSVRGNAEKTGSDDALESGAAQV